MEGSRPDGVMRHADFRRLWAAQTLSQLGSQVTFLALPLTAVVALDATPAQMGLLTAAGATPALLVGLYAGVVVDRRRRRPILVATDLGRAALLATVPAAALLGLLRVELLYVVAFLVGALGIFFDVAYRAFLPALVPRDRLVEGNSRLELSQSAAEVAGPGLAGGLVQLVTAPVAIAADACSFAFSGLLIGRIRSPEPPPDGAAVGSQAWAAAGEGLRLVLGDPRLRALAGTGALLNLFNAMLEAVFVLYVTRSLGLGPAVIGAVFGAGSVGFLVGALLPERAVRRFGWGKATVGALVLVAGSDLLVPLAGGPTAVVVGMLFAAQFLFGLGLTTYRVNQVSLRQSITPDRLLGRMDATVRVMSLAGAPAGALLGGLLGEAIGLRPTLAVAAVGELLAVPWIWWSPLRHVGGIEAARVPDASAA